MCLRRMKKLQIIWEEEREVMVMKTTTERGRVAQKSKEEMGSEKGDEKVTPVVAAVVVVVHCENQRKRTRLRPQGLLKIVHPRRVYEFQSLTRQTSVSKTMKTL